MRFAASPSMAGVVPVSVATLTEGVLSIMAMSKLKTIAIALMGAGVVTAGATGLAFQAPGGQAEAEQVEGGPQPKGRLPDASPRSPFNLDRDATPELRQVRSLQNADDELELLTVQLEMKRAAQSAGREIRPTLQRPSLHVTHALSRETRIM